jgi:hypothetical protein
MRIMVNVSVKPCTRSSHELGYRRRCELSYSTQVTAINIFQRDQQVGYRTTDSAQNNGTASVEFAAQLLKRDNIVWDPEERHIPCVLMVFMPCALLTEFLAAWRTSSI